MKKFVISIIFIILIMYTCSVNAETKAVVGKNATRVRAEQSTESKILTVIYEGDECEILQEDGEWYKIKFGQITGFVKKEFLEVQSGETTDKVTTNETKKEEKVEDKTTESSNTETENAEENSVKNETVESTTSEQTVEKNSVEILLDTEYTVKNETSIRAIPCISAKEREKINANEKIKVVVKVNNWYKISSENYSGWVTKTKLQNAISSEEDKKEIEKKVKTQDNNEQQKKEETNTNVATTNETTNSTSMDKKGVVNVETARVREKASKDSEIIGTLDRDNIINIISEENGFYKFTYNSISGYVAVELITIKDVTSRSLSEQRKDESVDTVSEEANSDLNNALSQNVEETSSTQIGTTGKDVVEFAKQYLGYAYVSAGKTPETGFDCSGFTKYVFGNFGIEIGATAASQSGYGTEISRENLQVGDLLIFNDEANSKIGHVGIYIGNGEFIHSANPKRGVVTDNLNTSTYYNARYVTARRLL